MRTTKNADRTNCPQSYFFKGIITYLPFFLLSSLLPAQLTAAPYQQDSVTGHAVFEAEHADENILRSGYSWIANFTAGYSGDSALRTSPIGGWNNKDPGYSQTSPQLDYQVNFVQPGTHYVWVRGYSNRSSNNSVHIGLDGAEVPSSEAQSYPTNSTWTWVGGAGVASFDVTSPGVHTVNVWMREAGFTIDKLMVTTDADYTPEGFGPAESPRGTTGVTTGSASNEPIVTLSTNSLNFGSQNIGGISDPSSVKLTNTGTGPLYISSINTSSGFIQSNNCNDNISIGGSCVINVQFVPISTGTIKGSLTINSNTVSSNNVTLVGIGADGSLPLSSLTPSGPIVINGERDVVISGLRISNPNGNCIEVRNNALRITIENSEIGPCGIMGISILDSKSVTVRSSYIHDTADVGIRAYRTSNVEVSDNQIDRTMTGVNVVDSQQIKIDSNRLHTVNGMQSNNGLNAFIQIGRVSGYGIRINNNVMVTELGTTDVGDDINLWKSHGMPDDPIQINNNVVIGSGPRKTGGGIMLGDGGSSYAIAKGNILVNPGASGVAVAGGHDNALIDNTIYSTRLDWSNVGLYVWDQYKSNCRNITVRGNRVNWTKKDGKIQGAWNGNNCGAINGWSDNDWQAPIGPDIAEGLY